MIKTISGVDEYISNFPVDVQKLLQRVRTTIRQVVPEAEEVIKYAMPTYVWQNINLVHFAGYKNHVGFYPVPSAIEAFQKELSTYKGAKGSVQFPIDQPMPLDLIRRIVEFRKKETEQKAIKKKKPEGPFTDLSAPAQRALANNGITSLKALSQYTEKQLLQFHGMGPGSIPKIKNALAAEGLSFKDDKQ
jgi:uncharacterized protein YdhG (YjbR/CyaY superfamily)